MRGSHGVSTAAAEEFVSETYTKLFSSITNSTVWEESYATRIAWVTLLAMADARGNVYSSVPGLARRANVTREEIDAALASFQSPDRDSRTTEHDGRRIEAIDGGWHLLNHAKYASIRDKQERRDYMRDLMRKRREQKQPTQPGEVLADVSNVSKELAELAELSPPTPTPTPTPVDQEQDQKRHGPPLAAVPTSTPDPASEDWRAAMFSRWKAIPKGGGGAFLNSLFRDHKPESRVLEAVERTLDHAPADPKAFVLGVLRKQAATDGEVDALMRSAL